MYLYYFFSKKFYGFFFFLSFRTRNTHTHTYIYICVCVCVCDGISPFFFFFFILICEKSKRFPFILRKAWYFSVCFVTVDLNVDVLSSFYFHSHISIMTLRFYTWDTNLFNMAMLFPFTWIISQFHCEFN